MDKATVNQKLELMQQIRARYQRDRYDMSHRERILYGRISPAAQEEGYGIPGEEAAPEFPSTLPLRFLLAVGLFLVIVLCDKSGSNFVGIPTERCFQAISADYESSIAAWADTALHP